MSPARATNAVVACPRARTGVFSGHEHTARLQDARHFSHDCARVTDVRQKGFMAGIELKGRLEDRVGAKVCQAVRKYGVILRPLGNVIVLMPPLSISIEELDYLLMATYRSIEDCVNKAQG